MTLHALRPDTMPALDALVDDPARVADLELAECTALVLRLATLITALGARLVAASKPTPGLQPPLSLAEAAPLLGMKPDTLRRRAKTEAAFQALVFDNGTDKLLFDPAKVEAFRKRRTG